MMYLYFIVVCWNMFLIAEFILNINGSSLTILMVVIFVYVMSYVYMWYLRSLLGQIIIIRRRQTGFKALCGGHRGINNSV